VAARVDEVFDGYVFSAPADKEKGPHRSEPCADW